MWISEESSNHRLTVGLLLFIIGPGISNQRVFIGASMQINVLERAPIFARNYKT